MFIRECIHIGIINLHELSKYYRQFLLITQYLVSKNWMVPSEQSHAFFRRFCSDFANHILQWLQLKQLDHLPINPCDLANIYKATTFVLMGTGYTQLSMTQPTMNFENMTHSGPILTPLQPNKTMIKIEALTAAIANLTEMFKSMMERGGGRPRNAAPHPAGASRSTGNFCRGARHFIWECKVITEYNWTAMCKHNHKGKVVLPSGAKVPCNGPGNWLCSCMDEWHWRHILEVAMAPTVSFPSSESASQSYMSYPTQSVGQGLEVIQPWLYTLRQHAGPQPMCKNMGPAQGSSSSGAT